MSRVYILVKDIFYDIDFVRNLAAGILSGILIFIVGLRWKLIRSFFLRDVSAFKRIFGIRAVEDKIVSVTLDTYHFNRDLWNEIGSNEQPFIKGFPAHTTKIPGAFDEMLGYCSARGAAYLIDSLGKVKDISVRVVSDYHAASEWSGTFINLGSSASNQKTDYIKHLPQNKWLEEDINGPLRFRDGWQVSYESRTDKGIVMKLNNPHSPGHALLVCAGLGEWGTSGAAWFLANYWKVLSKRFGRNPFLIVVAVSVGSDQTTNEIRMYGVETRVWRARRWIIKKLRGLQ